MKKRDLKVGKRYFKSSTLKAVRLVAINVSEVVIACNNTGRRSVVTLDKFLKNYEV